MSNSSSKKGPCNQPLVSICIPSYNAEKTVVSTLQSILNQTYQNLEIIIVDNVSIDNTLALLQNLKDPRIKIYTNSKNIGAEKNWSGCIELASGEYIAIFHADDLYKPDMVEKQVQAFLDNPSISAVFTMANSINDRGEMIGENKLPAELKGKGIYYFSEMFTLILRYGNFLICPSAMVRSEIYKALAPFNDEQFGTSADLDMWFRILERHPIAILDEKLMRYRISNEVIVKVGKTYTKLAPTPGCYVYNHLRTEKSDFFKVMDLHLSVKSGDLNITHGTLNNYEFLRSMDNITRAANLLIKGQSQDAKKLLKESFFAKVFIAAMSRTEKPKFLAFWVFGVTLLVLIYLGLGQYLNKMLFCLLYRWRMRLVNLMRCLWCV